MPERTIRLAAACLAALLASGTANAACRSGPPPGTYSANDNEGITLDISPITRNPLFGAIGNAVAEATQGVTNLRQVVNMTQCPIAIRKQDGWTVERKDLGPGQTLDTNFWVPWADDAKTYGDHHMVISVDGRDVFWLWQDNHVIRFRTAAGYVANGQKAPGVANGGGDRSLVVALGANNKPVFAIANR